MIDFDLLVSILDQTESNADSARRLIDRLLTEIDAAARQDEFRAKLLELCYRQLEIAMKQLDASNKSALAILHH
jgi:hypothetical protein